MTLPNPSTSRRSGFLAEGVGEADHATVGEREGNVARAGQQCEMLVNGGRGRPGLEEAAGEGGGIYPVDRAGEMKVSAGVITTSWLAQDRQAAVASYPAVLLACHPATCRRNWSRFWRDRPAGRTATRTPAVRNTGLAHDPQRVLDSAARPRMVLMPAGPALGAPSFGGRPRE